MLYCNFKLKFTSNEHIDICQELFMGTKKKLSWPMWVSAGKTSSRIPSMMRQNHWSGFLATWTLFNQWKGRFKEMYIRWSESIKTKITFLYIHARGGYIKMIRWNNSKTFFVFVTGNFLQNENLKSEYEFQFFFIYD